ncbi:MAG: TM0106 family RecB-like putative nuclease [bacterium]
MRKVEDRVIFSPTDLAHFAENPYVTWMDRLHLEHPDRAVPDAPSEELEIIAGKGLEHERTFLQGLREAGRDVCAIPEGPLNRKVEQTQAALLAGREVIYQAALQDGEIAGYADFLVRVDVPSSLGSYAYEPWDTKLSLEAKPHFLIQLCAYAKLLEGIQGTRPERFVVVLGDGTERVFRTDDYFFYYLHLERTFRRQQEAFIPDEPPEPLRPGKNGRWETAAAAWLESTDHLLRVADIRNDQIQKLRAAGIDTMTALAKPGATPVPRLRQETHEKLQQQARLQIESTGQPRPRFEIVEPNPDEPRRGLALLPPPSPGDVVFDIEGYPLTDGGLEYLLGAVVEEGGELRFLDWWAHNDHEEKRSFERFVDWVHERWRTHPDMHVYHYASYEVTAMRRLMGKHGTREREVDDFLRNEVFVDLYKVVHQGLRVGTPSYSLKDIEHLYMDAREGDVATAGESIVFYQRWLEAQDGETWETSEILRQIRDYNEEDCRSTCELVRWLRGVQAESGIGWVPRPGDVEVVEKDLTPAQELAARLLGSIPEDRSEDPERWRVHELLAWLLEFHRREDKPMWWRLFDRHAMTETQLWEDLDCLASLQRTETRHRKVKQSWAFEYRFDANQDTKIQPGDGCFFAHDFTPCTVQTMDPESGTLEIKLGGRALSRLREESSGVPDRLSLIPNEAVSAKKIAESIERTVRRYEASGELPTQVSDLLFRRRPRLAGRSSGPILTKEVDLEGGTLQAVVDMEGTTLCIQGPPGTGKTHTGARVILELLKRDKTVGISANSHKAILNLMRRVASFAADEGVPIRAVKIGGDKKDPLLRGTRTQHAVSLGEAAGDFKLYGATAWPFSSPDAEGMLDYLFVDEAGQVSLANLIGMAPSARNLVLLGDQMQLGQPIQGSHPGESGLSALDYLLQDHPTIPPDLGIFLAKTWRLHPDLCRFISDAVYEGRLEPEGHTRLRRILPAEGGRIGREAGLLFVPVQHEGHTQGSEEEVAVVTDLAAELLRCRHTNDTGADVGDLSLEDILIVAPYNLQVRMLKAALGEDARVGTIDKFQGQEAPVVIVSMAASAGNTSPRGIDFLFDKNRLNVAISRAQSLAVVVGHPALARTPCSTVTHVELLNLFGRVLFDGAPASASPAPRLDSRSSLSSPAHPSAGVRA